MSGEIKELYGLVFDIKELAVFDGPGIRTTVFMKGCPLRCSWCHNPEGLSFENQVQVSAQACTHCGRCAAVCPSPQACGGCGRCVGACPQRLRRLCGVAYTPEALARLLLEHKELLEAGGGGVTFSGGEPLCQADFLVAVIDRLQGMHTAVETSGCCPSTDFARVIKKLDYVLMDIKLADPAQHRLHTGADNRLILENLEVLKASGKPYTVRVPLIPGVTDTVANLDAVAGLLKTAPHLERVELLPYHQTAGAKYPMVGRAYTPSFDAERPVNADCEPFERRGIRCVVM